MFDTTHRLKSPIKNDTGGAAGIVIAMVLVLALVAGAGFWVYQTHYKKGPLRTTLSALKTKAELIRFTHDRVSRALYRNLIMLDDIVVMMDKEQKRLKRIGRKFPKQNGIVSAQAKELREARERLGAILKQVTTRIEKIYVTWLVDRAAGIGQINSQKGTLTRQLADAIRGEAVLIGRIRSNPGNTS
ncbi:MAG: hypothetical protein PVG51_04500 [Desulfosarcina sp.]|jgi:signal recognition particle subunit SEC65